MPIHQLRGISIIYSKTLITMAGKNIIRIDVPRSLFVHKSPNEYFRRIGSSKREMRPNALAKLFQQCS